MLESIRHLKCLVELFFCSRFRFKTMVNYLEISYLVLEAQTATKDYIRAEGDFHKEIHN